MENEIDPGKFVITGIDEQAAEALGRPQVSYLSDAWRRLRENKMAIAALAVLLLLIFMVIFGPSLSGYRYEEINSSAVKQRPGAAHWFGTDKLGRDMFARVWQGGRISILIGVTGALVSAVVGCIYGGIAAYFGGIVDDVMMRVVEIIQSVPNLIIVILLSIVLQSKSVGTLLLALTLTSWVGTARLVRGQMLQIRSQEYIMAARCLGVRPRNIILRHMIPNMLNVVIVSITFDVPGFIFSESFLSYIGLGIQPPETSWGALASSAQPDLSFYPYLLFFPALMIALTMLSFTLLGDGLRDALDPRMRK
jgi:oligopeptide transport system permease protein